MSYEKMKRDELRAACKEKGLSGYGKLNKAGLIELLKAPQASAEELIKALHPALHPLAKKERFKRHVPQAADPSTNSRARKAGKKKKAERQKSKEARKASKRSSLSYAEVKEMNRMASTTIQAEGRRARRDIENAKRAAKKKARAAAVG